ncbi:MAG: GGDEF domain-containing protein [Rickettsiales bacterium]
MLPANKEKKAPEFSKRALALMDKYNIPPTPENYFVWFQYAIDDNEALRNEISTIISNDLGFTKDNNEYLYHKYVISNRNQKVLDDATINTQKILVEALKIVNDFSGETQNYNDDTDKYLEDIVHKFGDNEDVKNIFKEIIDATANLRKSGEKISNKLKESTREINNLRKDLQQVTIEAQRDFLTGVYNRKSFERLIDEQMIVAKENNSDLCLLMLDVDHFKKFNDKFGHLLGDEVLKIVARTLTDTLKGRDVVARFGGEEFVVFLPETPIEGAVKVAEMIRNSIAGKGLKRKDTGETFGSITVSIGVSLFRHNNDTLPTLIKRADDALYVAKDSGRNQVVKES